ncbi:phospho-glucose isomerase C-terminal SIS domain-containing protein [Pedococcus dokdonensis]|uniref:Phospho-glucose isomerase C-terminal SIS domain-containing protein n=1 Tax=Pedococcus dokdonensis TaxID=443156 RepID=A0A1H0RCX2_9MICO|nr:SIS domain-containing protein [Pedococcus dokdonensis]SDP27472.1 phospho-glucose isomerase C-terminal SIS domain-containing protein [Pedococcus dokdonensis]
MASFFDESRVDSDDALAALDSHQTLRGLATSGAQVREAVSLAEEAGIERVAGGERPRSVLVASLGGSAVVCDVLELLAEPGSPVPVSVRRNVPLPGWVGPLDLVVAVSLSGRAPGPLALAAEAARRGAALLTVGAVESPLAEVTARARGVHIGIGRGRTTSRTALWSLLAPVLLGVGHLGLVDVDARVLAQTADRLDELAETCRPSSESFVNPAKVLAADLAEGVPVVLGDGPLNGVAAGRAASMLARTARVPATSGELPDDAAQIVACFDGPFTAAYSGGQPSPAGARSTDDIFADPFLDGPAAPRLSLLMLRDVLPDPMTREADEARHLAEAVTTAAREAGVRVSEVTAQAGHPLTRLAGQMATTDYAATYLALGLGLDPAVSPHVADLRDRAGG